MTEPNRALITGISGQDGSYLAELLLDKGYEVFGSIRRKSDQENELGHSAHLEGSVEFEYMDVTDSASVQRVIKLTQPDEIYNLAGQSQVRISFDIPAYTAQVNALGPLNILETCRTFSPRTKIYQAGTSEIYGNRPMPSNDDPRVPYNVMRPPSKGFNEDSRAVPVSPYGSAKLFAHNIMTNYRESYDMFAANGILFNHESPRRGMGFVTQKIVYGAVEIALGVRDGLELGNLAPQRDWGHARDYVEAMWRILQHPEPTDFVIATGKAHSIQYLVDYVFTKVGLDSKDYVTINQAFVRPNELDILIGDASKARDLLKWAPQYSFEEMLNEMIAHARRELMIKGFRA